MRRFYLDHENRTGVDPKGLNTPVHNSGTSLKDKNIMPKKRKDLDAGSPDNNNLGEETSNPSEPKKEQERISFPITADGKIDFDNMKKGNRERVEAFLRSQALQSQFPDAPAKRGIKFEADKVTVLYDALALMISEAGHMFFKWPTELTQFIKYSEEQKQKLGQPTADLLERYAPDILIKHQELATWALIFGTVTKSMVSNAVEQFKLAYMPPVPVKPNGHAEVAAPPEPQS